MKYYSIRRPITPGAFPKPQGNKILRIENFHRREYCRETGQDCWGYIEYEKPLTEKEAAAYELVRERLLDFSHRYSAIRGTLLLRTFATVAELNEWFYAQSPDDRRSCNLGDGMKHIEISGIRYMRLKPEERWRDDPQD